VFENTIFKNVIFSKEIFGLRVGWIYFHKIPLTNPKKVISYWGLFLTLKGIQLFINKP
jgi:hypothetical protein